MSIVVSVVVLTYQGRAFVPACLESLRGQDFPGGACEVIVADNGSSDGTADAVRERFPGVRVIAFGRNLGFAAGNNRAAGEARGRYLAFVNQDLVLHRSWLRRAVAVLEGDPDAAAVHGSMFMPWSPRFSRRDEGDAPPAAAYWELCRWGYARYREEEPAGGTRETLNISGGAMIIRRDFVEELEYLFDPEFFLYGEDLDLALRLNCRGWRILMAPGAVAYHRHHRAGPGAAASLVKAHRAVRNRLLAYYKNMTDGEFLLTVPLLLAGSPLKARDFGVPPGRRLLYGAALVPLTATAFAAFLLAVPRFREARRRALTARIRAPFWLARRLWALD